MGQNPYLRACQEKIIDPVRLQNLVRELRNKGMSIATCNGSFDLLHSGHLYILSEAKTKGDALFVLLNSDESIKGYKGPTRPIIPLKERLKLLSAISFIDYLSWFDEQDPRQILEIISPDVHVNGIEYGQDCIEAATVKKCGGSIHLVPRIDGLATSSIIEKVKHL